MLENARLIMEFTSDLKFYEYQKDRMCQLAVERNLEIIGEVAARISTSNPILFDNTRPASYRLRISV